MKAKFWVGDIVQDIDTGLWCWVERVIRGKKLLYVLEPINVSMDTSLERDESFLKLVKLPKKP